MKGLAITDLLIAVMEGARTSNSMTAQSVGHKIGRSSAYYGNYIKGPQTTIKIDILNDFLRTVSNSDDDNQYRSFLIETFNSLFDNKGLDWYKTEDWAFTLGCNMFPYQISSDYVSMLKSRLAVLKESELTFQLKFDEITSDFFNKKKPTEYSYVTTDDEGNLVFYFNLIPKKNFIINVMTNKIERLSYAHLLLILATTYIIEYKNNDFKEAIKMALEDMHSMGYSVIPSQFEDIDSNNCPDLIAEEINVAPMSVNVEKKNVLQGIKRELENQLDNPVGSNTQEHSDNSSNVLFFFDDLLEEVEFKNKLDLFYEKFYSILSEFEKENAAYTNKMVDRFNDNLSNFPSIFFALMSLSLDDIENFNTDEQKMILNAMIDTKKSVASKIKSSKGGN